MGYRWRVGLHTEMPLFQREARGKVMARGNEPAAIGVETALCRAESRLRRGQLALGHVRSRDRVTAATEALRLAKTLEEGERTRFNMGSTTVLFVNIRERHVVEMAYQLYRAQADYAVGRGGMLWARGALSKPWPTESLAKYGNPMTAAGMNGYKRPGRD